MKKILIVGGTGFLGFNTSKVLQKNYKILSISLKKPKKFRKLKKVKYLIADISKIRSLRNLKKKLTNISYVINFGGHVDHNSKKKVFDSHYVGAKNLMDFFLNKKIDLFIQIGSSMEYGKIFSPQKEYFQCKPLSHYGKAKLLATNYAQKLFLNKKFPVVVFRPYQIYGPYQDRNRLIPFIIDKCLKNEKFPCSSGKQYRDFLYVDDFIECIKKSLISKKIIGNVFNIGVGKAIKVKKIILHINKKIKKGYADFGKIQLRKEELRIVYPQVKSIKKILGWKPKINFDKGINKTINYYKKNFRTLK